MASSAGSRPSGGGALASSLVACLRFAAPLLDARATPQQICTKATLGALVVDAHRLAQQAAGQQIRHQDPRRLLCKLLPWDSELARVAVADITWDAEGLVTQTLEMELQDVEERGNSTLNRNFCVVIAVFPAEDASDQGEAALLWFPYSESTESKKYLLYVVPGRIKVVKNLVDLVKRMHEEMPALRSSSATYRVWTLVEARAEYEKTAAKKEPPSETMPAMTKLHHTNSKMNADKIPEKELQVDNAPTTVSPPERVERKRVKVCAVDKQSLQESESMFAFPKADEAQVVVESRRSRDDTKAQPISPSSIPEKVDDDRDKAPSHAFSAHEIHEWDDALGQVVLPSDSPTLSLHQKTSESVVLRTRKTGVSSSHAHVFHRMDSEPMDLPAYQSVDSDIKKHVVDLSQYKRAGPIATAAAATDGEELKVRPKDAHTVQEPEQESSAPPPCERLPLKPVQVRASSPPDFSHNIFQFTSTRHSQIQGSMYDDEPHHLEGLAIQAESQNQLQSSVQSCKSSTRTSDQPHSEPATMRSAEDKTLKLQAHQVASDAIAPKKKKKSARDRYRNKLGARGWWELEYQTTKLLQQQCQVIERPHPSQCRGPPNMNNRATTPAQQERGPETEADPSKQAKEDLCFGDAARDDLDEPPPAVVEKLNAGPMRRSGEGRTAWVYDHTRDNDSEHGPTPDRPYRPDTNDLDHRGSAQLSRNCRSPCGVVRDPPEVVVPMQPTPVHTTLSASSLGNDSRATVSKTPLEPATNNCQEKNRSLSAVAHGNTVSQHCDSPNKPDPVLSVRASLREQDDDRERSVLYTKSSRPIQPTVELAAPPMADFATRSPRKFVSGPSCTRGLYSSGSDDDEHDSVLMATVGPSSRPPTQTLAWYSSSPVHHHDTEEAIQSTAPFGRVPIRHRQNAVVRQATTTPEPNDDQAHGWMIQPAGTGHHALRRVSPVVETFTVEASDDRRASTSDSPHDEATRRARQQKLFELRQRKIQQLQREREQAVGKKKQQPNSHTQLPQATHAEPVAPLPTQGTRPSLVASAAASGTTGGGNAHASTTMATATVTATATATATAVGAGESFSLMGGAHVVRVRKPSNRKLVQNAVEYTLLAGGSYEKERLAALQAMAGSMSDNFIVLLKSAKELKFRALYEHHVERGRVVRLFSLASSSPPVLSPDVISQFFRYNSGKKAFMAIDSREFTVKTDACALVEQLVFKKKALNRLL